MVFHRRPVVFIAPLLLLLACEPGPSDDGGTEPGPSVAHQCAPTEPEVLLLVEASLRMGAQAPDGKKGESKWTMAVRVLGKALPKRAGASKKATRAPLGLLVWPREAMVGGYHEDGDGNTFDDDYWAEDDDEPEWSDSGEGPVCEAGDSLIDLCTAAAGQDAAPACSTTSPQVSEGDPLKWVKSVVTKARPGGSSPTTAALASALSYFEGRERTGRARHVVLVTDGPEDCGGDAALLVQQLRGANVDVWVVAFSDSADAAWLDRLAEAGGHPLAEGPRYRVMRSVEDMLTLLDDIVAVSHAEVCDGVDNDCDGKVDGHLRPCEAACGGGAQACTDGAWGACGAGEAGPSELCDGVDNDCDGVVDEDWSLGVPCQSEAGACVFGGTVVCAEDGTTAVCSADAMWPGPEVCDGVDNDCDGQTDEGTSVGCAEGCQTGVRACVGGVLGPCVLEGSKAERCDGKDNDCDGETDEGYFVGAMCVVSNGGCVAQGVMECTADGEASVCSAAPPTSEGPETCDGQDNDCDGEVDEGPLCPGNQKCIAAQCIWD